MPHRQALEIFGAERRFPIDAREDRMGVGPGAPLIGLTTPLQLELRHPVQCSIARTCPYRYADLADGAAAAGIPEGILELYWGA